MTTEQQNNLNAQLQAGQASQRGHGYDYTQQHVAMSTDVLEAAIQRALAAHKPTPTVPSIGSESGGPLNLLFAAKARARAKFGPIERTREVEVKTKDGRSYKFKYAPLDVVLNATLPHLAAEEVDLCWMLTDHPDGGANLTCLLTHSSGAYIATTMRLPAVDSPQARGSQITYGRRYQAQCVLGVASEEDDDGNQAAGNDAKVAERAPTRRAEPATKPATAPHQPPAQQPRPRTEASPPEPGQSMPRDGAARGQQVGAGPQPSGNGSQPPPIPADAQRKPQESPALLAVPQAIKDLLDSELAERLKAVSGNLGFNRTQATEFCMKVTGKEARNLDRGEQEILLTAAEAEYRSQNGGEATQ